MLKNFSNKPMMPFLNTGMSVTEIQISNQTSVNKWLGKKHLFGVGLVVWRQKKHGSMKFWKIS